MSVTKDQLLGYQPELRTVTIKGLGTVYARSLTGEDQQRIRDFSAKQPEDELGVLVMGIIAGVCDENGEPLFDRGDFDSLKKKPFGLLKKLGGEVWTQSGLDDEEVEGIEGKSETTES